MLVGFTGLSTSRFNERRKRTNTKTTKKTGYETIEVLNLRWVKGSVHDEDVPLGRTRGWTDFSWRGRTKKSHDSQGRVGQ